MTVETMRLKSHFTQAQLGREGWEKGLLRPARLLKARKRPLTPTLFPGKAEGEGVSKTPETT